MEPGYVVQRDQSCPIDFLTPHIFFYFPRGEGARIGRSKPPPSPGNRSRFRSSLSGRDFAENCWAPRFYN